MATSDLLIDVRLNLEGNWPRSVYQQHCQQQQIEYTEEGYLQWRAVGERLSGRLSFETAVQRASTAFAAINSTFTTLGPMWQKIIKAHEERRR